MRAVILPILVLTHLAVPVLADVESGPKGGDKVPALKVSVVVGEQEGKDIDIAAERKQLPTVFVLVNAPKFSRPIAQLLRELDKSIADTADKGEVIAVWVGGEFAKNKEYLPRAQMSLKLGKTSWAACEKTNPDGWSLNDDAHVTIVTVKDGKIVKSWGLVSANGSDAKGILESLKK